MTYTISLTIGATTWTATEGVRPAGPPALLDGLTLGWSMPDGPPPQQPGPVTVTTGLFVASAADMDAAGLDLLAPMFLTIQLHEAAASPYSTITFTGRVSELNAAPHHITLTDGTEVHGFLVTIHGTDYTADLVELDVGDQPWPQEGTVPRLGRIFSAIGHDAPIWSNGPDSVGNSPVAARDVDNQPAAALLEEYLRQYRPMFLGAPVQRYIVAPYTPAGDFTGWVLDYLTRTPTTTMAPLPATVTRDPLVTVTVDTSAPSAVSAGAIDACRVPRDSASWSRTKLDATNRLVLSGNYMEYETGVNPEGAGAVTINQTDGRPPVTTRYDVSLRRVDDAKLLGALLLPENENPFTWTLDQFTWRLDRDPVALANMPPLFPDHTATPGNANQQIARTACYHQLFVLEGIHSGWSPVQDDRYVGRLAGVTLSVLKGDITAALTLAPNPGRPFPNSVLSGGRTPGTDYHDWNSFAVASLAPSPRWTDLAPTDTWTDYRIARRLTA